jgi:predicted nucleic acid-binding protein
LTPQDSRHINTPCVVLDTNAVLDWLLFQDPRMDRLSLALLGGAVQWVATPWMQEELLHMLVHIWPNKWNEKSKRLLGSNVWNQVVVVPTPNALPDQRLKCTDPDDQAFLDLALSFPARWLITRDKSLLKVCRQAALLGLQIQRPEDWQL